MPSAFANFRMVNTIAAARLKQRQNNLRYRNYAVFDFFQGALLLNYNLDGIAGDLGDARHCVVPVHGSVAAHLGSPETTKLVARFRDIDIDFRFEDLLLCVPEPHFDEPGQGAPMWTFDPDFVRDLRLQFRFPGSERAHP